MLIARTRMQQLKQSQQLQQQSSQRVGALSLIPPCLGISGHPSGSRQTQFSTADHCVRNTPNTFSLSHFLLFSSSPLLLSSPLFSSLLLSSPLFSSLLLSSPLFSSLLLSSPLFSSLLLLSPLVSLSPCDRFSGHQSGTPSCGNET